MLLAHFQVFNKYNYVHEFVLTITNNMWCTQEIREKSAHVCNYYGIYMLKVHVNYIAFVTIIACNLYTSQYRSTSCKTSLRWTRKEKSMLYIIPHIWYLYYKHNQ